MLSLGFPFPSDGSLFISAFCFLPSAFLEVMAAVRKVEALIAERKVGDLAAAQGEGQAEPVVKGGIGDLVTRQTSGTVSDGHVADLPPPPLGQRDDDGVGLQRAGVDPGCRCR